MSETSTDKATGLWSRAINIFFLNHPQRMAIAIAIGMVLDKLVDVFQPTLNQYKFIEWSAIDLFLTIPLSIILLHIRTIIYFIKNGSNQNEEVEKFLLMIEEIDKRAGLNQTQRKLLYAELYKKFLASAQLTPELKAEINKRTEVQSNESTVTPERSGN